MYSNSINYAIFQLQHQYVSWAEGRNHILKFFRSTGAYNVCVELQKLHSDVKHTRKIFKQSLFDALENS